MSADGKDSEYRYASSILWYFYVDQSGWLLLWFRLLSGRRFPEDKRVGTFSR